MAFLAALPEIAEAAGAAGEAGAAAGEAGAAGGEGGGLISKVGSLFKSRPDPMAGDQNKQQNVGESRTDNFQDAATSAAGQVRGALRPGGVD